MIIGNAISLNMLPPCGQGEWNTIDRTLAQELAEDCESCIGHADMAAVITDDLGVFVECNRKSVSLEIGDTMLVCQYKGPRLQEGAVSLPEGAKIEYVLFSVV